MKTPVYFEVHFWILMKTPVYFELHEEKKQIEFKIFCMAR